MNMIPLLPDAPADEVMAFHRGETITRADFLRQVHAVGAALPSTHNVLNLCRDRYLFSVGLCASVAHERMSLLPNTTTQDSINRLLQQAPDLVCLTDHAEENFGLPCVRLDQVLSAQAARKPSDHEAPMPYVSADKPLVCLFTSGSTGEPQPHWKTWSRYVRSGAVEASVLWPVAGGRCSVVGTVPYQHSYGMESTVLMPLMGRGILSDSRPFYPADVASALGDVPRPRLLVITPFHLRALLDADIPVPEVDLILSATAPLDAELASRAEERLGAPLMEIYGSTETGQMATRRTTREAAWTLFEGVVLQQDNGQTIASGGHVERPQALSDIVEIESTTRFRLIGRHSDMVNIAGKRSSIAFLNHILTSLPGVRDGCFCLPHDDGISRLAAFVVAPGLSAREILHGLRQRVDPVFLPRPLVFLDVLPRNNTGKVQQNTLDTLIERHISKRGA